MNVMFVTPTLGRVGLEYHQSFLRATHLLRNQGIKFGSMFLPGCRYPHLAKDRLLRDFIELATGYDQIFYWDDDVGAPPQKVVELVVEDCDAVGGFYPMRDELFHGGMALDDDGGPIVKPNSAIATRPLGLWKAWVIPGGFLKLKRRALKRIIEHAPRYRDSSGTWCWEVFQAGAYDTEDFHSEDAVLSKKLTALDIDIWIDPHIQFQHRGEKIFEGNLADTVRESNKLKIGDQDVRSGLYAE